MHQKQLSIRRSIRQDQLNAIKKSIRTSLILSNQQQMYLAEKKQAVEQFIQKDDLTALVELFSQSNVSLIPELQQTLILECFNYFTKKKEDFRSLALLKSLIQNHFLVIFTNEPMAKQSQTFLNYIYQRVDLLLQELIGSQIDYNGALSQVLSDLLQVLRVIYFKISHNYVANSRGWLQISKSRKIVEYIFPWLPSLIRNKHYLSILTSIITHSEAFGCYNQHFGIFTSNLQLFDALVSNICNCEDERQHFSFLLLRRIFQNCVLSQQFVKATINDFWFLIMSKFIADYNKKPTKISHSVLFEGFQALDRLLSVLATNGTSIIGTSFLFSSEYYQFLFKVLQYQSDRHREILYLIIDKSIEILQANKQTLLDYIKVKSLNQIISDLTNSMSHRLTILVLKIIYRLVRGTHMSCDIYELLMNYWLGNGVVYVLEILQFHKNREIALIASDLLENQFKQQSYQEMQVENQSALWQNQRNEAL